MDVFFKIIIPFILFIHLLWFKNKYGNDVKVIPCLLIFSLFALSSNYVFPFAPIIYQGIQIWALLSLIDIFLKRKFKWMNFMFIFIFFLVFILLSYPHVVDNRIYISALINFIDCALISIYLFQKLRTKKKFYLFLKYTKQAAFILALGAFINFVLTPGRVELSTFNPNYLAFFLGIGLSLSFFQKAKYSTVVNTIFILAIIFTASRAIILAIAVLMILKLLDKPKWLLLMIPLTIVAGQAFLSIYNKSGLDRFNDEAQTGDFERTAIYGASGQMIRSNPIIGVGYGQFVVRFKDYVPQAYLLTMSREKIVTHNDYLRILVETGSISFLFFLYVCVFALIKGYRLFKEGIKTVLPVLIMILIFISTHDMINNFIAWYLILLPEWYHQAIAKNRARANV